MSRIFAEHWKDYELIDAGNSKKLERWGNIVTIRPERNAYFQPVQKEHFWKQKAHFEFVEVSTNSGEWVELKPAAKEWRIEFETLKLNLKLTRFKHLGIFPEQNYNWNFISKHLKSNDRFLNLFGYTGAVSLAARAVGADVFHCDSVKQIITWGKENMEASGLNDIHWVQEDALKFAEREVKRGNMYMGIIMDPPAFGVGANKERWKIEDKIIDLLKLAKNLKEDQGFIILNTYSPRLPIERIKELATAIFPANQVFVNKLCIKSTTGKIIEYGEHTLIK